MLRASQGQVLISMFIEAHSAYVAQNLVPSPLIEADRLADKWVSGANALKTLKDQPMNGIEKRFGSSVMSPDDETLRSNRAQLSKLSSILNGLEGGAQLMQHNVQRAQLAVKAGTYRVDAFQLSKRIVGEALRTF